MALEENSLWNTGVWNAGFQNVDGIVLKVVVEGALTEAVVLIRILNDGLLEVDGEVKDLEITTITHEFF